MSVRDWFRTSPPAGRIASLDTGAAHRLAEIHATAFARSWASFEFERLLADRAVIADGLFLGQDEAAAGFVLSRVIIDEAEILTIALAPAARGRGYARPLLEHHFDVLARAGARTVHLEVEEENAPALALYCRLGFEEIGRREGYYLKPDSARAAAVMMKRAL